MYCILIHSCSKINRYRNAARAFNTEDSSAQNLGFRCARTAPGQETQQNHNDADINEEYIASMEARAAQGCPHANGILKSLEAQGKYKPNGGKKEEAPAVSVADLKARAAQGCPHAKAQLEKIGEAHDEL